MLRDETIKGPVQIKCLAWISDESRSFAAPPWLAAVDGTAFSLRPFCVSAPLTQVDEEVGEGEQVTPKCGVPVPNTVDDTDGA